MRSNREKKKPKADKINIKAAPAASPFASPASWETIHAAKMARQLRNHETRVHETPACETMTLGKSGSAGSVRHLEHVA
jgi:hypothetical protein